MLLQREPFLIMFHQQLSNAHYQFSLYANNYFELLPMSTAFKWNLYLWFVEPLLHIPP